MPTAVSLMQDSPYGITAKVADFGLSREMQSTSRIETRTCGTITHMPPELLSDDVVSKVPSCSSVSVPSPACAAKSLKVMGPDAACSATR